MNKPTLQQALPIVAAAYGKKFGIKIVIKGQEAKTDGSTIYLPSLRLEDKPEQTVLWGYLAHEAAHIRYTDFTVFRSLHGQPIRHALLNIVEDVRIERLLGKTYPGTHQSIHSVLQHLVHHNEITYPEPDTPVALLQMHCLFTLRLRLLKQIVLYPLQQQVAQAIALHFPAHWLAQLDNWFDDVRDLQSTGDALHWVDRLLASIEQLGQANTPNPNASETNTESDTDSDSNKQNSVSNGSDSNMENNTELSNTLTQGAQANDRTLSNTANNHLKQLSHTILACNEQAILPDIFTQAAATLTHFAEGTSPTPYVDIEPVKPADVALPQPTKRFLALALKESVALRAKLRGWLNGLQQQKSAPKQQGQRVLPSRLALSQAGETRLFAKRVHTIAPNAAIHLLVDRSTSMDNRTQVGEIKRSYSDIANLAALSLALALEGIKGVSLAVSFFGKSSSLPAVQSALAHGESVRANAGRFLQYPNGNTPMAEAIWFAVQDVLQQRNQRKIIVVITDGKPSAYCATAEVIQRCYANQIEVIGIGIKEDIVKDLFNQSVVIEDVATLKDELFKVFSQQLIGKRC